jgi:hypothetical protein
MLTLLGFAAVFAPCGVEQLLHRFWVGRLATMSDDEATAELQRIAALGDTSLRPLAAALESPRESVARTAMGLLLSKLDSYRQLPASQAETKLAEMAAALVGESDRFGPTAAESAALLAGRIVSWPFADDGTRRREIIEAAEKLLRGAPRSDRRPQLATAPLSTEADLFDSHTSDRALASASLDENRVFDLVAPLPGGGNRPEPPDDGAGFVTPPEPEPDLPAIRFVESENSSHAASGRAAVSDEQRPETGRAAALTAHTHDSTQSSHRVAASESGHVGNDSRAAGHEPRLYGVLRQLASNDPNLRQAAEAELLALGFNNTERWVARRSVDADPTVRRQLAETLPRMTGVNAPPWLLWLSRDSDARVRHEAMAVLATTGDPEILRRVEQLAERDKDHEIRGDLGKDPERRTLRR